MLFSNPEISKFVRENFVVAWESVRPVPIVEIDFGNGKKLRRTVNGNIATYICAPDGRVVDIITGLNKPEAYLQDLRDALTLYKAAEYDFEKIVLDYHKSNLKETTRYRMELLDWSKALIERPVKKVIGADEKDSAQPKRRKDAAKSKVEERTKKGIPDVGKSMVESGVKKAATEEELALAADTELNRKERKPLVHKMLSEKIVTSADITKALYREVLHCDLDDPYLGLATKAFDGGAYDHP